MSLYEEPPRSRWTAFVVGTFLLGAVLGILYVLIQIAVALRGGR